MNRKVETSYLRLILILSIGTVNTIPDNYADESSRLLPTWQPSPDITLDNAWSYKAVDVYAPDKWYSKFTNAAGDNQWLLCQRGRHQSPIDIRTEQLMFDHSLKKLEIIYNDEQLEMLVENIGQDLQLRVPEGRVSLRGGPLSYEYIVHSIRVKFGSVSSIGSDHRVNGQSLPGELQIFAFNGELYHNATEATHNPHGLTAISVFFKVCDVTNKDVLGIVAAAENTIFRGQTFHLRGVEFHSLLLSTNEYITYEGSLPFPGCYETVTWIILNHPISVSETEEPECNMRQINYVGHP